MPQKGGKARGGRKIGGRECQDTALTRKGGEEEEDCFDGKNTLLRQSTKKNRTNGCMGAKKAATQRNYLPRKGTLKETLRSHRARLPRGRI